MPDLDQIVVATSRSTNPQQPQRGVISKAPATMLDGVHVIIPEYDEELSFGPCLWMPRGSAMPVVGANCFVVFSNQGEPFVAVWEGDDTPVDPPTPTPVRKAISFMPKEVSIGSNVITYGNPSSMSDPDFLQINDGVDGLIGVSFIAPDDILIGTDVEITLKYTTSMVGGNIAVEQNSVATADGDSIFPEYVTSPIETIPAPGAAEQIKTATLAATVPTQGGLQAGNWCRVTLGFMRTNAADTNTGILRILGVTLGYDAG